MLAARLALILGLFVGRLPKPPETVVFETVYGRISLDHRAHLARRAPCRVCHGSGSVGKVGHFGKDAGHQACLGCHMEKKGPVKCGGCHIGV